MGRLTDWQQLYDAVQAELTAMQVRHQQQLEATAAERAELRRILDAARAERDQAREALALWSAAEYSTDEVVRLALSREQRALSAAARIAAERDQAIELARQLAAFAGAVAGPADDETRRVVTRALWLMRPVRASASSSGAPPSAAGSDSGTYGAANG
jgi:hypothetical protein